MKRGFGGLRRGGSWRGLSRLDGRTGKRKREGEGQMARLDSVVEEEVWGFVDPRAVMKRRRME